MGKFAAAFGEFERAVPARLLAVRNDAVQAMIFDAQRTVGDGGRLPVDTGYLRASLIATLGDDRPGVTKAPEGGGSFSWDPGQINLVVDGAPADATLRFTYSAAYAMRVHYGFDGTDSLGRSYNQAGRYWVTMVAQNWQRYINAAAAELGGRMGARTLQAGL